MPLSRRTFLKAASGLVVPAAFGLAPAEEVRRFWALGEMPGLPDDPWRAEWKARRESVGAPDFDALLRREVLRQKRELEGSIVGTGVPLAAYGPGT